MKCLRAPWNIFVICLAGGHTVSKNIEFDVIAPSSHKAIAERHAAAVLISDTVYMNNLITDATECKIL